MPGRSEPRPARIAVPLTVNFKFEVRQARVPCAGVNGPRGLSLAWSDSDLLRDRSGTVHHDGDPVTERSSPGLLPIRKSAY